jgi:hypothetical protein
VEKDFLFVPFVLVTESPEPAAGFLPCCLVSCTDQYCCSTAAPATNHLYQRSTANEVTLKDSELPEGLKLIDGSLEAYLGKVDVGSSAQHSYMVVAEKGSFAAEFQSATVTYQPELENKEKQVCARFSELSQAMDAWCLLSCLCGTGLAVVLAQGKCLVAKAAKFTACRVQWAVSFPQWKHAGALAQLHLECSTQVAQTVAVTLVKLLTAVQR